jgi:hypothetical protein
MDRSPFSNIQTGHSMTAIAALQIGLALCLTAVLSGGEVFGVSVNVTVSGMAGPWQYVSGGLNSSYQYGQGDELPPTVVTSAAGFSFTPGDSITVTYLSGTATIDRGISPTDARGRGPGALNSEVPINGNSDVNGFGYAPSRFFNSTEYPAYYGELVGTFADGSGQIVGTPFNIGDLVQVTVPAGATQLQFGVNDTKFSDNTGSWKIQVSEQLPKPPSLRLVNGASMPGEVSHNKRCNPYNSDPLVLDKTVVSSTIKATHTANGLHVRWLDTLTVQFIHLLPRVNGEFKIGGSL